MNRPTITEQQIQQLTGQQSYNKGKSYFRSGAIFNTYLQEDNLIGSCVGSHGEVYQIRVKLVGNNIQETTCTCPYDWGDTCKHIIALLLTYLHKPESVARRQPVPALLAEHSQAQLIDLITQIVRRYPDVYYLLQRPIPSGQGDITPQVIETIKTELRQKLNDIDEYDYGYGGYDLNTETMITIQEYLALAERYITNGNWAAAEKLIIAINEVIFSPEYEHLHYESLFPEVLQLIANVLRIGLAQQEIAQQQAQRQQILTHLLTIYTYCLETESEHLYDGIEDTLLQYAKPEDFPLIRHKFEALESRYDYSYVFAEFSMRLDALDNVDVEVTLQQLRAKGFNELVIQKLLELNRVEEAIQVISATENHPRTLVYGISMLHLAGHSEPAIQIAEAQLAKQYSESLIGILENIYRSQNNYDGLLKLAIQRFYERPEVHTYAEIKPLARQLNAWDTTRPKLIAYLEKLNKPNLLIHIYLHDEDFTAALRLFRSLPKVSTHHYNYTSLGWQVAQAVRFAEPMFSLPYYQDRIHQLIEYRTRSYYAEAVGLLKEVLQIYETDGDYDSFYAFINELKLQYKTLRAFHDELKRAGF